MNKEEALSEAEQLHMKIAKATFLTLVGERTIDIVQNQNPKGKVLEKDLKRIKAQ